MKHLRFKLLKVPYRKAEEWAVIINAPEGASPEELQDICEKAYKANCHPIHTQPDHYTEWLLDHAEPYPEAPDVEDRPN